MTRLLRLAVLLLPLAALSGCSVNPATGQQSFTGFMSPEDEMRVGAEEHPKMVKQFGGRYKDLPLSDYVASIGSDLVRHSEMPKLNFTFTVLNDDIINAFALPGGYVYISRGLLAMAENEAEVAGVLAHEIGHITARHTAQRYSQAMATNLGLTGLGIVGSILGLPSGIGNVASIGAELFLKSYSREQELEADRLGVRYMTRAGYDPDGMTSFFVKLDMHHELEAKIKGADPKAADQYNAMATHPRTKQRIDQALKLARLNTKPGQRLGRDELLSQIDGLVFGDDMEQGVRKGRTFSHPGLAIEFTVPPDFTLFNMPHQVVGKGPGGSAVVYTALGGERARAVKNLSEYVRLIWIKELGLQRVEKITVNGMEAATGAARAQTRGGARDVRLVAVRENPTRIHRLMFLTSPDWTKKLETGLQRTTFSLRRLSPAEVAAIRPLSIDVIKLRSGDSVARLSGIMAVDKFKEGWFRVINGLKAGQTLTPGRKVKVVVD